MKAYTVQKGDTLKTIATQLGVENGYALRTHHNLYCPTEDLIHDDIQPGQKILIPEDPQFLKQPESSGNEEGEEIQELDSSSEENFSDTDSSPFTNSDSTDSKKEEEKKEQKKDSSSSEHDGKYFVIQKGMCQCNQGFKFPKFKATSHQKHYWNNKDGEADFLAVTEDDLTLDPPAMPFGNCKLKPTSGGYLPCAFAPAGKWTKTYDKVKVMGKSCVTEISELMCATGGKITILKHGQQSEMGKSNVTKANPQEQHVYNPIVDYEEFQEEINDDYEYL